MIYTPGSCPSLVRLARLLRATAIWLAVGAGGMLPAADPSEFVEIAVQNTQPRRDTEGAIIDAHDGCLQFFEGRYYLYGTAYGRSAGFGINNRFRVYSSADLTSWRFDGELLREQPPGVFYRPYVVYNVATRKYVLWFNWYPQLWDGLLGVATSDTPEGPFTIVNTGVQLSQAAHRPGDGSLFVDDDGTAYFIYTVIGQDHAIRVEKLTADYCDSAGEVSEVLASGCEAPALFRRGDTYYALFDTCCCFCEQGSGVRVYTATRPLGPYELHGNINRDAQGRPTIAAQQTYVARVPTPDGNAFLWMGDLWGSRPDGVKGHDLQYWSEPLVFNAAGDIAPLAFSPEWKTSILRGAEKTQPATRYALPKRADPAPLRINPCTGKLISPAELDTGEQP
ncbi:MAG TPA: family 43 glycosylhydrolase [Opitutaceae bacterium]|nr:family 43 glycosylhydrolase [Opitutaceae bacterium]